MASDPSSEEAVRSALEPFGWTLGPEFWDRYHSDPWVFNLVNAAARLWSRTVELDVQLQETRERNERLWWQLNDAQERSIEARNPGIDMDEVRRIRSEGADDEH